MFFVGIAYRKYSDKTSNLFRRCAKKLNKKRDIYSGKIKEKRLLLGYFYNKKQKAWQVYVKISGKIKYFGSFHNEQDAKVHSDIHTIKIMNSSLPDDISDFKDIPKYDGYKISKDGRILSLKRSMAKEIIPDLEKDGYFRVGLCNSDGKKKHMLHRLLYTIFVGDIPDGMSVDHIDRNKQNNNLDNLRLLTNNQNRINSNFIDNARGYYKGRKGWTARIFSNGKRISLGTYNTEEEAHQAYLDAKKKYHILPE